MTDYMKKLSRRLREANPDFTIYVKVGSSLMGMGGNNMGKEYAERGVDVPALMKIPGLKIGVSRGYTSHAWNLFRGLDEGDLLDGLYDANLPLYRIVKEKYGAWNVDYCLEQAVSPWTHNGIDLPEVLAYPKQFMLDRLGSDAKRKLVSDMIHVPFRPLDEVLNKPV